STCNASTLDAGSISAGGFAGVFSISSFTSPPAPLAALSLLYCPGSVAMLADTRPARPTRSRCLPTTPPANSGSPKPSDPWPPLAADTVGPPRSVHLAGARAPENVLAPLARALTALRATAIVLRPYIGRRLSEYCRSCRAPNTDLVPSARFPSTAQTPAHSRPFGHTVRRLPPSPLPTWRNPDSHGPAKRGLPRSDRRGCRLPPASAVHIHTRDGPLPPTRPAQSRDHSRRLCCTLSPARPWCRDFPDTAIARAAAPSNR